WDEVVPGVLIGRALSDLESAEAIHQGVTAVLDLTAELSESRPLLGLTYRNIPILDLTAPTRDQLHEGVAFIATHAENGVAYVHWKIGYSRSAAVVAAYLLATDQAATVKEAVQRVRDARPSVIIRTEAMDALSGFECQEAASCPVSL